jgi:ubiquinol-cytochrome c reductase cytochrome b subunit
MGLLRTVGDWLDDRTSWRDGMSEWLDAKVFPRAVVPGFLAAAVLACLAVLGLTGVVLMTAYAPSPQTAWASVHYVQYVQQHGWIVRGLHYWAAQGLFVFAALHVLYGALAAGYRQPREVTWWLTLAVLGLTLGELITGGLLPWDQRGWWARVVEGNITGLAPVIGGFLEQMMSGGPELGALGLARAYTVHVVLLPLAFGVALWARYKLVRRDGWQEAPRTAADVAYVRLLATSVVIAALVALGLFAVLKRFGGAPLDAPADPLSDYPARPEWFLLTLYELRKFFHGPLEFWGTTMIPGAAAAILALLPWIDRGPRTRVLAILPTLAIFAGAIALGVMAWRHDRRDAQYMKARAKWDGRATAAVKLALGGVPPSGPLDMERHDPEMRGRDLFETHCASCHVLEDMGDKKKASASKLDGWGTADWIDRMIHNPDAPEFFGRGPYNEQMPSVDVRPTKKELAESWTAMVKNEGERRAVALFLAAQGDEPGDPPRAIPAATRALAEKIVSERCTTCHLYKGDGDDEGSGLAPELAHYGSLAWTRAQIANPASPQTYRAKALDPELKKHMPRFDKDLSAADIDILAQFTRAHGRGQLAR